MYLFNLFNRSQESEAYIHVLVYSLHLISHTLSEGHLIFFSYYMYVFMA